MNIPRTTYPLLFDLIPLLFGAEDVFLNLFLEMFLAQIISTSSNRYNIISSICLCFKCTESSQVSRLLMVLSLTHTQMLPFHVMYHWGSQMAYFRFWMHDTQSCSLLQYVYRSVHFVGYLTHWRSLCTRWIHKEMEIGFSAWQCGGSVVHEPLGSPSSLVIRMDAL